MDRILVAVVSVSWLHFLFIPSPFHLETTDESHRIGKDLHAHVCMSAHARAHTRTPGVQGLLKAAMRDHLTRRKVRTQCLSPLNLVIPFSNLPPR